MAERPERDEPPSGRGTRAPGPSTELVRRARAGDREAFGRLYEHFGATVHGVLLANVPRQDVHDLVQDVFLSAWKTLDRLAEPERFGAWLVTIARNRARDAHRLRRVSEALDQEPIAGSEAPAEEELAARELLEVVRELPAAYRTTLVLRLVEGLTGPEIADRTGLTHGSVRVNLHRGMALLRERLNPEGEA